MVVKLHSRKSEKNAETLKKANKEKRNKGIQILATYNYSNIMDYNTFPSENNFW